MASRGTTHPVRRSTNPFMSTTSSYIGLDVDRRTSTTTYVAPEVDYSMGTPQTTLQTKGVVDLMYQTSGHVIGEGVERGTSRLSAQMDQRMVQTQVRAQTQKAQIQPLRCVAPEATLLGPEAFGLLGKPVDLHSLSAARKEHPMYTTSTREVGQVKAEMANIDTGPRLGIPNHFTNSFNGLRYRDFGLNTAVTKSRVCDLLDQ